MPIQGADEKEQFAILTKSFEEFIGLKNSAYVDINNCPFAFSYTHLARKSEELVQKLCRLTSTQQAEQLRQLASLSSRVKPDNEQVYYLSLIHI